MTYTNINLEVSNLIDRARGEIGTYKRRDDEREKYKQQVSDIKSQLGNLNSLYSTPHIDELIKLRDEKTYVRGLDSGVKIFGTILPIVSIPGINVLARTLGGYVGIDIPLLSTYLGIDDIGSNIFFSGLGGLYFTLALGMFSHLHQKYSKKLKKRYGNDILKCSNFKRIEDEINSLLPNLDKKNYENGD